MSNEQKGVILAAVGEQINLDNLQLLKQQQLASWNKKKYPEWWYGEVWNIHGNYKEVIIIEVSIFLAAKQQLYIL